MKPTNAVVRSMTGFASGRIDLPDATITVDIRTVNSRYADVHFRLAEELRELEPMLREAINRAVARGKVECRMLWRAKPAQHELSAIDPARIDALLAIERQVRAASPAAAPLSVAEILRLALVEGGEPRYGGSQVGAAAADVDAGAGADAASLWTRIEAAVQKIIADCIAAREREGGKLASTIIGQIDAMTQQVGQLRPMLPMILEQSRERLSSRLADAMPKVPCALATAPADGSAPEVDPQETFARIRQEVALVSLRGDVTEELDRLEIHLAEVRRILGAGGSVGKRLDFISQELNREANTLASKATGLPVTDAAVSLKLLIEQMREQAQNIE